MSNTLVSLPLSALIRSKVNVRKTERNADIETLAASIASQGLLENLVVRINPLPASSLGHTKRPTWSRFRWRRTPRGCRCTRPISSKPSQNSKVRA